MIEVAATPRYVEPTFVGGVGSLSRAFVPYTDREVGAREAAAVLGVTVATLARWRSQGISPAYMKQPGRSGRVSYSMSDLHEWKARHPGTGSISRSMLS